MDRDIRYLVRPVAGSQIRPPYSSFVPHSRNYGGQAGRMPKMKLARPKGLGCSLRPFHGRRRLKPVIHSGTQLLATAEWTATQTRFWTYQFLSFESELAGGTRNYITTAALIGNTRVRHWCFAAISSANPDLGRVCGGRVQKLVTERIRFRTFIGTDSRPKCLIDRQKQSTIKDWHATCCNN